MVYPPLEQPYLLFIRGKCDEVGGLHSRSYLAPSWPQTGHTEVGGLLVRDLDVPSHLHTPIKAPVA